MARFKNIRLKEFPGWVATEANDYECIRGAIIIARVTGSKGATEQHQDVNGLRLKFATVKRL